VQSILNHGLANFKLEILVYCSGRRSHPTEKCIKIEQDCINFFKPSYNILKIAGSSFGAKRSEETRAKISAAMFGITRSPPPPLTGGHGGGG
jgi:group I intron endonuclease